MRFKISVNETRINEVLCRNGMGSIDACPGIVSKYGRLTMLFYNKRPKSVL